MKASFIIPVLLLTSILSYSNEPCDNLYSEVTYALSHAKKAMSATNFEHQMYYAERALTAMDKAETYRNGCGCVNTEENTYQIQENLKKAIEPIDWEAGKFFTNKSKGLINELITILDECSTAEYVTQEVIEDTATSDSETLSNNNTETLALAKYISTAEKRFNTTTTEVNQLIEVLESQTSESSAIQMQQKMYLDRTKKLLQVALAKLEEE